MVISTMKEGLNIPLNETPFLREEKMNKSLYNIFMFLYFTKQIKTFLFCDDCEDHLMFYVDKPETLKPYFARIQDLLGKKKTDLSLGKDIEWAYLDMAISLGVFPTKGEEDEEQGAYRVELDLLEGKSFNPLLKDLYLLEVTSS